MSSTSPNLGLTLYDSTTDQVVTFATFRAVWGGPATTSNFYKIDTAWGLLDGRIDILEAYRGAIPTSASFISANYYEATVSAITAYTTGMTIILSVDTTSSGTVTLNINALGTKSVMKVDSTGTAINLTGSDLVDGRQYLFIYDGTRWTWVSANSADQIQIVGTAGNFVKIGSTNNLEDSTSNATTFAVAAKGVTNGDSHDHVGGDGAAIVEGALSFTDITTNNASTTKHGLLPKLSNVSTEYLNGVGSWVSVSGAKFSADGRLTLTTATPVTTSNVTGATTVYYTPFIGNQIGLYSSSVWTGITFSELSLALGTVTSGLPYDIFIYNNAGTATMEKLAWTDGTTRATALTTQDGVLVKTGDATRRYIGTIYTTSTTATEDSLTNRYVWNLYNRVPRLFYFTDTTNSWSYTTAAWRQWDNTSANQVNFVVGWTIEPVEASFTAASYCTGIVNYTFAGIGLDRSTTASDAKINGLMFGPADTSVAGTAIYQDYPSVGKHYLAAMEYGRTSATFVGDDGNANIKTGLSGSIIG